MVDERDLILRTRAPQALGVERAEDVQVPEDVGLNTRILRWARWEGKGEQAHEEFKAFYERVVTGHGGDFRVVSEDEWATELEYELPLWAYLLWDGENEYDVDDLMDGLEAGIEWKAPGRPTPVRDRFLDRFSELLHVALDVLVDGPRPGPSR